MLKSWHRWPGTLKLGVWWTLLIPDPEAECGSRRVKVTAWYCVTNAEKGRVTATRGSKFYRDLLVVLGRRPRQRGRLPINAFDKVLCEVLVRTVTKDERQRDLCEAAQYSVVHRVLSRVAGGSNF
jgi:hypothetical protein